MPHPPQTAHPDATVTIVARIPGWLKNRVLQEAEADDISINGWLTNAILTQLNHGTPAPPPRHPLPTPADELRAYMTGETLLGPCGKPSVECVGVSERIESASGDFGFCSACGIRCI